MSMKAPPALIDELVAIKKWSQRPPGVETPEVDSALMQIGSGASVIATGIHGAWGFDFRGRITGWWIQEIDGTSGSVSLDLLKAPRGAAPSFASIVASAPPLITSALFNDSDTEDPALTGWTTLIERGDIIRLEVDSVTSFTRLLIGLRIRRLEP